MYGSNILKVQNIFIWQDLETFHPHSTLSLCSPNPKSVPIYPKFVLLYLYNWLLRLLELLGPEEGAISILGTPNITTIRYSLLSQKPWFRCR